MKNRSTALKVTDTGVGGTGLFPQTGLKSDSCKRSCTPGAAGLLASFYTSYARNLAVLGELHRLETPDQAKIQRLELINDHLKRTAKSYAANISLGDWKRRVSTDTKLAFSFLGFSSIRHAKAFTFRLGYEVAEAALAAKKGYADYLSARLRTLGIVDLAFVGEFTDGHSEECHGFHIHGAACIPDSVSDDAIRTLLAPRQKLKASSPIKGYRQRGNNKAIDTPDLATAGGWLCYSIKEIDATARILRSNPAYASRSATRTGRALYESLRAWIGS
jgi:hypothetical protein